MRPIKFRAWHFTEKKMLEVDELNHIASWSFDWMLWVNGVNRNIWIQWWKHNDCVVMQSTWLVDKNGKEIYEGDVIEKLFYGKDRTVIIERDKDYWGFNISYRLQEWIINTDTREVIGNIYENPELATWLK